MVRNDWDARLGYLGVTVLTKDRRAEGYHKRES